MSLSKALTAAAGNAGGTLGYVEDVFSTYLYAGNASTQTITNGIDLDGEGGMVWIKDRTTAFNNAIQDTERWSLANNNILFTNGTQASQGYTNSITSFNSDGFTLGSQTLTNATGPRDFASWTFRKAEKFFDVVTWTGDGTLRNIPHNLGSTPAVIIVKSTSNTDNWYVQHTSLGPTKSVFLDTTSAATTRPEWGNTAPTDSVFTVDGTTVTATNYSGRTYVAYLFASDAGGFGDDGSESIIKCGSYVGNGTYTQFQNLGFEPQWILFKNASAADDWWIYDSMRGLVVGGPDNRLAPNLSSAEAVTGSSAMSISATGFTPNAYSTSGQTYIYMAIRRPMKTPESGTEVFDVDFGNNVTSAGDKAFNSAITVDAVFYFLTGGGGQYVFDRMRGGDKSFGTASTAAESSGTFAELDTQTGVNSDTVFNFTSRVAAAFKRATGFMDVVAYSGSGVAGATQAHNLGVVPEFMIVKPRGSGNWATYNKFNTATDLMYLNEIYASDSNGSIWNNTTPTDTVFTLGSGFLNTSNAPFIAYLFASLDGVSKVGSYTGTGSDLNVDCGFSAGARFILIKRTDGSQYASGGWYVWDSVRGIVAGNDPYLLLNSTAAEVTNTDYIDPLSSGFTVTSSAPAALNASGGNYIFLAIA